MKWRCAWLLSWARQEGYQWFNLGMAPLSGLEASPVSPLWSKLGRLVYGYGEARQATTLLWQPPTWTRHVAAVLVLVAFVLVAAAYVPGTRIKSAVGHPMILGAKVWALAHLLANGTVADVVLFGAFLAWAIVDYAASRRRDRAKGTTYPPGPPARDAIAVVLGAVAWAVFAFWLHGPLIGVRPFA